MQGRQHISAQFAAELDGIRSAVMEMGGKVERQIMLALGGSRIARQRPCGGSHCD